MKFYVVTPPYGEPPFDNYGSDVVVVYAINKRQARVHGLAELRKIQSGWVQKKESNKENPFNGLKVELYDNPQED